MPNIDLIPVPQYAGNQPYHYFYDNLPLDALVQREQLINSQVDINSEILRQTIGTAGSLPARLNQSLEDNGDLRVVAVDNTMHNIGYHTDGAYDGVDYVRMELAERQKLSLIAAEATSFSIGIQGPSDITYIDSGVATLVPSTTIDWTVLPDQKLRADVTVGLTNAHQHYDNIEPVSLNVTPDYQNYLTNLPTQFTSGSLKVFINGVRIFSDATVYVPTSNPLTTWQLNSFTEFDNPLSVNYLKGFSLLNPITINDIIRIDFEVALG
jgi:hypothetical protein